MLNDYKKEMASLSGIEGIKQKLGIKN
jgi:hypothetical protein